MDLRLKGKFAIVCASTKGLGFAVAKSLLNEGCEVLICSSKEVNISLASEILLNEGLKNFHTLKVDLSTNEGVVKLFKFAVSKSKRIDILVNNCGGPDLSRPGMRSRLRSRLRTRCPRSGSRPFEFLRVRGIERHTRVEAGLTHRVLDGLGHAVATHERFSYLVENRLPGFMIPSGSMALLS